jgi:YD repeat-containing protein
VLTSIGPDGRKTSFKYDSRGLPIEVISPGGAARFGYDANGNRIWTRDSAGSTEYYYDAFDRLSAAIWDRGPKRLIAYQYDHTGLISRISIFNWQPLQHVPSYSGQVAKLETPVPSDANAWHERERQVLALTDSLRESKAPDTARWLANDTSYLRNFRGDLQEIRSGAGTVRFNRSADGNRVERILPNGVHSFFDYTSGRRLSGIRHVDSFGSNLASFSYNYDDAGRLQDISGAEQGRPVDTAYRWDNRGRLQRMTIGGAEFLSKYDEQARHLAVTSGGKTVAFTYDSLGRVSKAKGIALGITPEGSLIARRDDGETTAIRYDYQSRPLEITTRSSKFRCVWDAEGNLVSLVRNGKTVDLVPAPGTGIRLPFVEFEEDAGLESKLLVDQSVLGRVEPGGAQFYIEDGSGGACTCNQGLLINSPQSQPSLRLASQSLRANISVRGLRTTTAAGTFSGAFLLTNWDTSQRRQPADSGCDQLQAQAQGWWEGFWQMPSPADYQREVRYLQTVQGALQVGKNVIDQNAAELWRQGGIPGKGLSLAELYLSGLIDFDVSLTKTTSATASFISSPRHNLFDLGRAWGGTAVNGVMVFYADKMLSAVYEPMIVPWVKPAFAQAIDPLAGRYLGKLFKNGDIDQKAYGAISAAYAAARGSGKAIDHSTGESLEIMYRSGEIDTKTWGAVTTAYAFAHELPTKAVGWTIEKAYGLAEAQEKSEHANPTPKPVGGVQFSSSVRGEIGKVSGAVYDLASGSLVLVRDNDGAALAGLKAQDLDVALRLAYSESPEEVAFSLDPADPKNPRGPLLQKVYYPDEVLAGTDFGRAMFDADWLLKQYSFGVIAEQGKPQRMRTSNVAGYKSVAELSLSRDLKGSQSATMSRFWIVSGEMKIRRDGSAIVFDKASMGVKTKRLVINPNSKTGLSDDDSVKDPIHEEFARRFTEHYDELAVESPELDRVRELAKAVAIAKWLRQNNVPVDLSEMHLDKLALQSADPDAHREIPALSTTFEKVQHKAIHDGDREGVETMTRTLYLFGGVDLSATPQYISDRNLGELQKAVQEKVKHVDEPRFQLVSGGRSWTATILPLTREALLLNANSKTFLKDSSIYRLNSQNLVEEIADSSGSRARYRDPEKGLAGGVDITGENGWHAIAQAKPSGTSIQLTTARGNQIDIISDAAGAVGSITVDGRPWAEYRRDRTGGSSVRLRHGDYSEVLKYDDGGKITSYQLERLDGRGKVVTEGATVEYSPDGLPTRASGTDISETRWEYDDSRRPKQITSANGESTTFTYEDKAPRVIIEHWMASAHASSPDEMLSKLVFENNQIMSSESAQRGRVEYKYRDRRLISIEDKRFGETKFSYDGKGRPKTVTLPSRIQLHYKFPDAAGKPSADGTSLKVQLLLPGS